MPRENPLVDAVVRLLKGVSDRLTTRIEALEQRAALPGPAGDRGARGEAGERGEPGEKGERGDVGPAGARGEKGDPGFEGPQGAAGSVGPPGPAGPPGRDGRDGLTGPSGEKGLDGKDGRDGAPGRDGFGFDDLVVEHDGERTVTLKFVRGEQVKTFPLRLPVTIYRGVWDATKAYELGDQVTRDGSMWIATAATKEIPGDGATAWVLATKRGREGKPGPQGEKGAQGKDGRDGRDLTQMDFSGKKW